MVLILLLVTLLVYLFKKPIYFLVFSFLKWRRPVRKFTVPTSRVTKIIRPQPDEYELEAIRNDELLTISGNSENGGFLFIQVVTRNDVHSATIYIFENGKLYSGDYIGRKSEKHTITCGPLLLDMRLPFRTWRINFRGYLSDSTSGSRQFVSIGGWWKAVTNVRFFYSNAPLSSYSQIYEASPMSIRQNISTIESYRKSNLLNQLGEIHAEVKIGDFSSSEHRYRGLRERIPLHLMTNSTQFITYLSDGNAISYRISAHDNTSQIAHGIIFKSKHTVVPISIVDQNCFDDSNMLPIEFAVRGDPTFEIRKSDVVAKFDFVRADSKVVNVVAIKVNRALSTGIAFVVRTRETLNDIPKFQLESFPEYQASESESLNHVLPFAHRACQDKSLTGGKGANLARLQAITRGFHVPPGVVVTTRAFEEHVKRHPELESWIKKLEVPGETNLYYSNIGTIIEKHFIESEISTDLISQISDWIPKAEFYAVRSSAVGEDGADLSSAGQLESYLDTEKEDIGEKLKLCWASNFRKEVLNYRRNYGQQLNPPMAVVIQEMNRNGVAGVMFTANPVKLDRGEIVINAMAGSGEQIVSGSETPDEIHVSRIDDTVSVQTSNDFCCLSDVDIQNLKQIGEHLESVFGKPQDIEFVVQAGKINIVQSRDITGLDKESEFEMYYELDTATMTDREVFSNGNVGEVLPYPLNAMEACTSSIMLDKILTGMTLREITDEVPSQATVGFVTHHRKVFINTTEVILRIWELVKKDRITDIVFAGELLFNDEMFLQAAQRFGNAPSTFQIKRLFNMIKIVFFTSYKILEKIKVTAKECEALVPKDQASIEEIFEIFEKQQVLWCETMKYHSEMSMFSSFTYVICGMLIRGSDYGSFDEDNISDFAKVFSNNANYDVISADVPNSLKKIAKAIKKDGLVDELEKAEGNDALDIIKKGETSRVELERFLELHGHRGPKELYLDATTWSENTDLLVHTIKSMLSCPETAQKNIGNEYDVIDSLKAKPKGIRRFMLKYFIGQSHRGVASRETAKNHLVSTTHSVRKTCRLLGQKLFEKGYLPDPNLWMHLNYDELKELNRTRSPKLISRAVRRRHIAPKFEGLQFPLVCHGHMNPIKPEATSTVDQKSTITLKGTPVCEGRVVAKARVAKTLEEAKDTKPGEILITRFTDICWSPFFPIISGIVTEIGGLLSHGAVVAREYGLPSLIAVKNATQHFQTGDLIELDSIKGTISRLEEDRNRE